VIDDSGTAAWNPKNPPKVSQGRRLAVYKRDNWTCQYCGRVIPPNVPGAETGRYAPWQKLPTDSDLVMLELDHIHPRSLGGDNSLENLRAACTPCNKRKLACTLSIDWPKRIEVAREILATQTANAATGKKVAAILLGVHLGDLPKPRPVRELRK